MSNNQNNYNPAYPNQQAKHENITRKLFVHQTDPISAASILKSQRFNPSQKWDKVGSIYFAETAPDTDNKAQKHGTYLMVDVYLGKFQDHNTDFDNADDKITSIRNSRGKYNEGLEYVIKDPERAKNIRYLDGIKPPGITIEMRDRMALIYAITAKNAMKIIKSQHIPIENRPEIAGNGFYLWENIPDARKYSKTGFETFLAADVHFPYCYESNKLPNHNDYMNYKSFRGNFHDTHFYMVKNPYYIKNIHYISGIRPKK